mmetsp:Transcript_15757/g.34836  ORF Transcript_15757/g.34836 Transcript_15757/m.34836 type:complete len:219 (+) Transcript_15757:3101-3757(+)
MGSTPLHSSALFPSSAHTPDCRPAPASSSRGHTAVEFDLPHSDHMFSTRDRACGDKVIANSASSPPAPGTPAASTPGSTMVASASRDCEGGSMWTPAFWPICFNSWRVNWNCPRRFNKLAIVSLSFLSSHTSATASAAQARVASNTAGFLWYCKFSCSKILKISAFAKARVSHTFSACWGFSRFHLRTWRAMEVDEEPPHTSPRTMPTPCGNENGRIV